jgi:hypothetical protein
MSSTVTMQDLELETAELLPTRETLCCCGSRSNYGYSFTQVANNGGTNQAGGFIQVSALNGGNDSEGLIVF